MPSIREFSFGAYVVEVAFLGETGAFALGDGTVRLVDGSGERTVAAHSGAILAATASEARLLTGGDDGRVVLTGTDGGSETIAERPNKWIDHVAAGPGRAIAFASGRQASVKLADGRKRTLDHERAVGGLAFAPKGLRLAVARYGGVTLWWVGTDAEPAKLAWRGAHLAVAVSPDGRTVVTAMQENALHGWRLADGKDLRMTGYAAKPRSLSWSAKGRYLATSGANAAILWPFHFKDGPMGRAPLQLGAREALVTRVACHPRQETVAIGYQDGMVLAVRFADAEEALLRKPGNGPISALAWDGVGRRLAFGTEEGAAGIVDIAN
ncbi:MAG: WD40 repeat domain-containing protein [Bauldia sp.]